MYSTFHKCVYVYTCTRCACMRTCYVYLIEGGKRSLFSSRMLLARSHVISHVVARYNVSQIKTSSLLSLYCSQLLLNDALISISSNAQHKNVTKLSTFGLQRHRQQTCNQRSPTLCRVRPHSSWSQQKRSWWWPAWWTMKTKLAAAGWLIMAKQCSYMHRQSTNLTSTLCITIPTIIFY